MIKKRKFKLLSYIVNDNLIFYKSINNNRAFIGFSVFYFESIGSLIPLMNYFLKKRYISYYSLQIDSSKRKIMIICFEDTNKNKILKCYSIIFEELSKINNSILILENRELEKSFLNLGIDSSNRIQVQKKSDNILIRNNNDNITSINYFKINFDCISKKELFIETFLSLVNNFNDNMMMIFNFKINRDNKIIFFPFSLEFQKKGTDNLILDYEINSFLDNKILEKKKLNIDDIGSLIWRLPIDNEYFYLLDHIETFYLDKRYSPNNFSKTILQIKDDLEAKAIKSFRINNEMLLINENTLCILIQTINLKSLKKIIERFYSKYNIFLILFDLVEYENIIKIEELVSLEKIKILNKNQFFELNINIFR